MTTIVDSLKQIAGGHLVVIAMLPIDKEMREFGGALRLAALKGGWTQEGVTMDTSRQSYMMSTSPGDIRTNVPQGTHCIATPSKDQNDHRAIEFMKILATAGVSCESGGRGYYPVVERATLAIYMGLDSE
jgi:hypothetical protein